MMAKAIRALELHYPMIHFLIKYDKTTLYLSVNVLSTKVLIEVTILISLETGPPFYVVMQLSSRLQGKGSTVISQFF